MVASRPFSVSRVVDDQPVRNVTILIFILCFLAMFSDGYDLGVIGLAAPDIVKEFGLVRAQMAPVFSFALFGMLVGALSSGFLGDKFGRKLCILVACAVISVASFATGAVHSLNSLLWCRFFAGIGLGGLLPNVTALMAEFLPKKVRGAFTTFTFMGITFGGIFPGLVSAEFLGGDWRGLFFVGGAVPLAVLPFLFLFLPESLKFLALKRPRSETIRIWLKKLNPDLVIPPDACFVLDETVTTHYSLSSLFADGRQYLTPLLWVVFISIMLVNFFVNSWLTLVLREIGFSHAQAAHTASLYYVGGVCGGLLIGPLLDYVGPIVLGIYAVFGAVVISLIGIPHVSHEIIGALVFLVGFSVLGSQVGMSSTAGLMYPTAMRSKGAGFAHAIGRFGAIGGPLLAGVLIAAKTSLSMLFIVPAIPLLIAGAGFFLITRLWTGRLLGMGAARMHQAE